MDNAEKGHDTRRIVAGTLHGMVEGQLRVSSRLRTLDYLNRSVGKFLTLQDSKVTSTQWQPEGSSCSVSVASILWLAEVEAMRPASGRRRAAPHNRAAVRLCLPGCEVLGFLHTPAEGDPISRLNQDQSTFIALTSASQIGEDTEFSAAFLAVNRIHVFAAETMEARDADSPESEDLVAAGSATGSDWR